MEIDYLANEVNDFSPTNFMGLGVSVEEYNEVSEALWAETQGQE